MKHDAMKLVNSNESGILFYRAIRKMNRSSFVLSIFALYFCVFGCATVPTTPGWKPPELMASKLEEGFLLEQIETKSFAGSQGISISGFIINNSGKDLAKAIFTMSIYDGDGNLLQAKAFSILSFKAGERRELSPTFGGTYIPKIPYESIKKFEISFGEKSISVAEKTKTLDELLKSSHYKMGVLFDELVEKRREDKKVFKAGYDEVFNVLVEIMSDIGNPVVTMDRANGLIVTGDERRSSYLETWRDKYFLRVARLSPTETQVGIKRTVAKKEGRDRAGQDKWVDKASDGVMENWILNKIQQKAVKTQSP